MALAILGRLKVRVATPLGATSNRMRWYSLEAIRAC
jgi:hypothetical protein